MPRPLRFVTRAAESSPGKRSFVYDSGEADTRAWFSLATEAGTLGPGEEVAVGLEPTPSLAADIYGATILVTSGDNEQQAEVIAQVGDVTACTAEIAPAGVARTARAPGDRYVPGQLLVSYHAPRSVLLTQNLRDDLASAVAADYTLTRLRSLGPDAPDLVTVSGDVERALAALRADPRVRTASPNYYLDTLALPNDPLLDQQWHLTDFGLPQAWEIETGQDNVTIAIIDSSVETEHEDLVSKLLPGCDLYGSKDASGQNNGGDDDPSPNPNPDDNPNARTVTHGTHVAGIAGARGDNNTGVASVAYTGVRILPVKVFDDNGVSATYDSLIAGMRWSVGLPVEGFRRNPNPARILNMSLGALGISSNDRQIVDDAVAEVLAYDTLVFAASGNDGRDNDIRTPADSPGVIAVGSIDQDLTRSNFSNYATSGRSVDLMAPGGFRDGGGSGVCISQAADILSTFWPDGYGCLSGTSMSTPYVSGVAALVWSQNPDFSADDVRNVLLTSTYRQSGWSEAEYGRGLVCADRALGAATLCGF
ncbi:MAG: S8 family serine peptidase [Trueperaceae bacterium]|nr:S8 family serine peptidase [Trueperaceae bacterium]